MSDTQLQFGFGALNGDVWIFEPAERRVIVTPDESLTDETSHTENLFIHPQGEDHLGVCRRCKKGDVYLIKFGNGETSVRCTYCK